MVVAVAKDELFVAHAGDFRQMAAIHDRVNEHRRYRTLASRQSAGARWRGLGRI